VKWSAREIHNCHTCSYTAGAPVRALVVQGGREEEERLVTWLGYVGN
jgi:hypothetical protein